MDSHKVKVHCWEWQLPQLAVVKYRVYDTGRIKSCPAQLGVQKTVEHRGLHRVGLSAVRFSSIGRTTRQRNPPTTRIPVVSFYKNSRLKPVALPGKTNLYSDVSAWWRLRLEIFREKV